jgi:hypothetical protein
MIGVNVVQSKDTRWICACETMASNYARSWKVSLLYGYFFNLS